MLFLSLHAFGQTPCTDYSEATLTGDTACSNSDTVFVRVHNTITGKPYQAYLGNKAIGLPVISPVTGSTISLRLPVAQLNIGIQTIGLRSTDVVCSSMPGGVATVQVNALPSANLAVTNDTICTNEGVARVEISNTQAGVSYQAYLGNVPVGGAVVSTGGTSVVLIPSTVFALGNNTLTFLAFVSRCTGVLLLNTSNVRVVPTPSFSFSLTANPRTVCAGEQDVTLKIDGAGEGIVYRLFYKNVLWQTKTAQKGESSVEFLVRNDSLAIGPNALKVKASFAGICGLTTTENTALVLVSAALNPYFKLKEDTIQVSAKDTSVALIFSSRIQGMGYLLERMEAPFTALSTINLLSDTLNVRRDFFSIGPNRIRVSSQSLVVGCNNIAPHVDTVVVIVKPSIVNSMDIAYLSILNKMGPNPLSNTLHISLTKTGNYRLRIMNALGSIVHEEDMRSSEATISSPWPSGSYYLEIEGEGMKERRKLIK